MMVDDDVTATNQEPMNNFAGHVGQQISAPTQQTKAKKQHASNEVIFLRLKNTLEEILSHFQIDDNTNTDNNDNSNNEKSSSHRRKYVSAISSKNYAQIKRNSVFRLSNRAYQVLARTWHVYRLIKSHVHKFDYANRKINGYRSLLATFGVCVARLLSVVEQLNEKKRSVFILKDLRKLLSEFKSWLNLMEILEAILNVAFDLQSKSLEEFEKMSQHAATTSKSVRVRHDDGPSLFFTDTTKDISDLDMKIYTMCWAHNSVIFSRTIAFQYCESLQKPLRFVTVGMAGYFDAYQKHAVKSIESSDSGYFSSNSSQARLNDSRRWSPSSDESFVSAEDLETPSSYTNQSIPMPNNGKNLDLEADTSYYKQLVAKFKSDSKSVITRKIGQMLLNSKKYLLDSDLKAERISEIMKNSDVSFCKEFLDITENFFVDVNRKICVFPINNIQWDFRPKKLFLLYYLFISQELKQHSRFKE
jgi:hypothetical protein